MLRLHYSAEKENVLSNCPKKELVRTESRKCLSGEFLGPAAEDFKKSINPGFLK